MLIRKRRLKLDFSKPSPKPECNPCECGLYPTWELNKFYGAGTLLCYNNVLYKTVKSALGVPQCTPENTPENYLIYRGTTKDIWMSTEYVQQGWQRTYKGKVYEAIVCYVKLNDTPPACDVEQWKEVK